jgi:hypothetical protein
VGRLETIETAVVAGNADRASAVRSDAKGNDAMAHDGSDAT